MFLGQGLAAIATHLMIVRLARRHGVWDPVHDALALGAAAIGIALVWTWNGGLVATLTELG
jgi:hypothetical protein